MASIGKIARRTFLFGAVAVVGGAAFGTYVVTKPAPNPLNPQDGALNAFVVINGDGITLIAPRAEMGQGTQTTWAALIAEELDVTLDQVTILHGPPAQAYFNSALMSEALPNKGYDASAFEHSLGEVMGQLGKVFSLQVTGGSTAMKDGFERMRHTGAAAREMLKSAAAKRLDVPARDLTTKAGMVIAPDGTEIAYTDLAAEAVNEKPGKIHLRDRSEWTILGQTQPRFDIPGKSTGTAQFAIDTRLPGMKFAAVRRAPTRAGMRSYDDFEARRAPGVDKVVDLGDGLAVIANNTWTAMKVLESIPVEWEESTHPATTAEMFKAIEDSFLGEQDSQMRDDGDVNKVQNTVHAEYRAPFLAHATMEPMSTTAWFDGTKLRIWTGNQGPTFLRTACADVAGIDEADVEVNVTLMGGGFGRRGEFDYAVIATKVAKAMPGTPINVVWSREEDMTHDFYRPAAIGRFSGAVENGKPVSIDAQIASPAVSAQALERWMGTAPGGPDRAIVDGSFNQPYGVPNYCVTGFATSVTPPVGFWRAVGTSFNGFFHESFMDELAHAAGADPMQMRLDLTRDEWLPAFYCLEAVRDMCNWTGETPEGVGRGLALTYAFGTPVAMVIEVQDQDGAIRLTNAWIAADPGVALDPGNIEAQLTGAMVYGLSAAMGEEITFANGAVEQLNFPDYEPLRMSQMPNTQVTILENQERIGGIGEVATPPAAPALANALFDLTGQRVRELPLNKVFTFAI
ncbi:xanthine dehydrogenase family protein molybdopterin-binding subunit [Tropicibacter naphthalenivorans]|uniref:Isoquinoline 1-oxidoreductase subunit beta n=1 Tax=Tropicibacter naphthalenivorans TaxID=441103 RepID=A0A0P1GEF9_9RHOB|nr:molybdopterin cofactor-binding domain-containing protein [Tropicibacter naphthalenivorans]CUH80040.1 Isoquinoline 1-oxidoreductase subunit beta [Tropicibacter naphthalenivorans]SMC83673.1 isoquinoline 1-oxidoreductase, beta subunit [Tropicibacter naphthalenivorans]